MKYLLIAFVLFFSMTASVYASTVSGPVTTGVSTGNGANGVLMVKPTANPPAGSYTTTQTVLLTGGAGTQEIRYNINGTSPSCSTGTVYTAGINVGASMMIQAISCYAQGVESPAASFVYVISTSPPSGGGGGGGGIIPASDSADFNHDGTVDITDLSILTVNWGSTNATLATGDANGDGKVDILDLGILATQWNG